jgi:hypothetical protein
MLEAKARLAAVRDDLQGDDDEDLVSIRPTTTIHIPFPFILTGSRMMKTELCLIPDTM